MSQHQVDAVTKDGQSVTVTVGWDRPLGGYFAMVEKKAVEIEHEDVAVDVADEDEDEESPYVYCNLDDPELAESYGMTKDLDYFVGVLERLGIAVPAQMLEALRQDGQVNRGNLHVRYDDAGNAVRHN